ncbi:MAG TPA: tetratricopeptide repeat protein [Candidatus Acidoferrales bacterium]|jgi:tetratricopeptide (TPR) repeat protein|nr:tetratricopeptide repeat protein [Candidatus Acidoferrales bacterium]
MKRVLSLAVALAGLAVFASSIPAAAQYANEFSPAKLTHQGTTAVPIAGSGTVVVQVQVNADGSHKATKVIKSTNAADNDAAMDIAQNSTYRPAHKGTTPTPSFYDFTLKFNGKSVAQSGDLDAGDNSSPAAKQAAGQIAQLLSQSKYAQAKTAAESALISSPSDEIRELLGASEAQLGQFTDAAAAFDKVTTVTKQFHLIAGQSYANASVAVANSNPAQALAYAQKAVALDNSSNSMYALGNAQLANKQFTDAIATLKGVHAKAFADSKTPTNAKVAIDSALLSAYMQTNDQANASATASEIKSLDPTSTLPARVLGNSFLQAGTAALTAKDYPAAMKAFDSAAAQGDPEVAVTAYVQAAFTLLKVNPDKPDFKQMQSYVDKALAIKPDSPEANFGEGIALTGESATSHDDATNKKALAALQKADTLAKAAGNEALALQVEGFIKANFKGAAGGGAQ